MAAGDIVKGAAKAGSFISSLLGVADEAISPAMRTTVRRDLISRALKGASQSFDPSPLVRAIDSNISIDALKRIADLRSRQVANLGARSGRIVSPTTTKALNRMVMENNGLSYISSPDTTTMLRLLNNYSDISPETAKTITSTMNKTLTNPKYANESMSLQDIRKASSALNYQLPLFQKQLYSEELLSEFGANSPAASMFSSFIDDGMSPVDARDAVRALLG